MLMGLFFMTKLCDRRKDLENRGNNVTVYLEGKDIGLGRCFELVTMTDFSLVTGAAPVLALPDPCSR